MVKGPPVTVIKTLLHASLKLILNRYLSLVTVVYIFVAQTENDLPQAFEVHQSIALGLSCNTVRLKLRNVCEANMWHKALKVLRQMRGATRCRPTVVTHLGDLDTPVEQQLRSDVVLVLVHVVKQAAMGHELGYQLDGGAQADSQETHQVGVFHAGHYQGLLRIVGRRQKKEN